MKRRAAAVLATLLMAAGPGDGLAAQAAGHSTGDWKRVETEHFLFLYPEELAGWALPMAQRMEAVRTAVQALVGYAPEERVTVLVDDPSNVSNGSMNPGPLLYMWPTPPNPRSMIGENRGWGEILAVHEFAHAAHLARPSRNPGQRLRSALFPIPLTRMMRTTPRWATEGYATYVEGRLTGAGRPHGTWRPAALRTWALEGQLPSYGQMSSSGGFYGGAFAYLAGSAFLEWLVEREGGDESLLPDVWARFTARQVRSFDGAFTGVFGAPPAELYGLFTVDVTENALAVRDAVEAAGGVVDGELFQRLSWYTGDPAVSPDGELLAVPLRSAEGPGRVVIMATAPDTLTTKARERMEEIFAEDPEDVRPVERRPRGQRHRATLWPTGGAAYDAPAWMPDGAGILVVRGEFVGNGRTRSDLFLWDWEDGDVRQITRGAGIREADPAPDGTWAAGLRCLHARCDVVRIDLATGDVTVLAAGDELSPWFRPRVSPDGRTIVASRQVGDQWRLAEMAADGSARRWIGPEEGSRFDADFLDAETLVLTSTASGIPQLELMDRSTGSVRPLTRVVSAAVAPAVSPSGEVFFLALHSRGWDLRRIAVDSAAGSVVAIDPGLTPAAAVPPVPADTFPVAPIGPVRSYGLGPRTVTVLPMGIATAGAYSAGAAIHGTDPIGVFDWQLRGMYGEDEAIRGGALDLVWRGWGPEVRVGGFGVSGGLPDLGPGVEFRSGGGTLDADYVGGLAALELRRSRVGRGARLVAGASFGDLGGNERVLGWADLTTGGLGTPGMLRIQRTVGLHGSIGRTGGTGWMRWLATGSLSLGSGDRGLGLSGMFGRADAPGGTGEAFGIGGPPLVLMDPGVLSQRISMPALPVGFMTGEQVWSGRAELRNEAGSLFYWIGDAEGDALTRQQVIGVDAVGDIPAIHYVRIPAMTIRLGLGRLLDEPLQNEWRAWAVVGVRP